MDLEIKIDGFKGWGDFLPIIDAIDPGGKYIERAVGSTNLRMSQWVVTRSLRGLSALLKIRQSIIRRRLKRFRIHGDISGAKVWYGLDGVPFTDLKPRKGAKGVITGDGAYYEEGAFTTTSRRTGRLRVLKRKGKNRYPVDDVNVDIDQRALAFIGRHVLQTNEFENRYIERLEQELKWRTRTT
ncbi:hypothetical protein [Asaia astilbis]|uniref:hypothetical protein n=1 Tax=Asaia astilbis TaxID=610244 RepID=UPI000470A633|nr:hypothetical protein [Asaia astilbis]